MQGGTGSRGCRIWEEVVAAGFIARHRIAGITSNRFAMTQGGKRMSASWKRVRFLIRAGYLSNADPSHDDWSVS